MMCCLCETSDSFGPRVADPEFYSVLAQIEEGTIVSDFVVYDSTSDEEVRFHIRYCPMCGRKMAERDR